MQNKDNALLVIATHNVGKLRDFCEIFSDYQLLSLDDFDVKHEVEEDGKTFLENAKKKALEFYERIHCPVLADDSGISIDSLDGFPGVLTHRWLGEDATDEERNAEIIRRAKGETLRFTCELALYDGKQFLVGHGQLVGKVSAMPRGENGFGFDPIFELPDGRTLAELLPEEKISLVLVVSRLSI